MKYIPLSVPNFEGNEEEYVRNAVAEGWVSTGGAYINQLEEQMATYLGVKNAVACQSGTAAIHLGLIESGVGYEDVVLVPTLTFIAAVNPVKYQMATPVFIDCDETLTMDPNKLEAFCTKECHMQEGVLVTNRDGKKVKAVVVVHVFGNMADMERIMEIANLFNLTVIEDATEALGTKYTSGLYEGKYAGTIGDYGAFSYNGNKIITTGGGGMLVSKHEEKLAHAKYLSTQAKDDALFYEHNEVGYNYRMTNVQAALGVAQMEWLPEFVRRKQTNYELYKELLEGKTNVKLMPFRAGTSSNCWFYALDINMDNLKVSLRELVEELNKRGVGTRPIWGLIHEQKPYRDNVAYKMEKAPYYAGRIINLPCSTNITKDEIKQVVETVCNYIQEVSL